MLVVPYCRECDDHVGIFPKTGMLPHAGGCITMLLIFAAFILGRLTIHIILAAVGLILASFIYLLAIRPHRRRKAESLLGKNCCGPGRSVTFEDVNELVFRNDEYGKAFADLNRLPCDRLAGDNESRLESTRD
jgi:hypothetical protein